MQRIWVQLCGKNRHKVIILIMHKRKRGNWVFIDMIKVGVACLYDEVQFRGLHRRGQPPLPFPPLVDKQQSKEQHKNNAQSHGWRLKLDVCAMYVWGIPFKWSILQRFCKFKLQFEFKRNSYALLSLFTQVNLVKHENRLHIQNPLIFLIILDILYALFGVKMNFLWISKVLINYSHFLDLF